MSTAPPDSWVPDDVPLDRPSVARMYDFFLGGGHNFAVDRQAAQRAIALWPDLPQVMQVNRAFLRRAVDFLTAQGIEQFLDIGSGIPTAGNVHEVAQRANPAARVVYVDIDPVAVAHSRALLKDAPLTAVIQADARRPEQVLGHPETARLLDLRRPVAVLVVALLHFVSADAEALGLIRALRDATPRGSYLALSHATAERASEEMRQQAVQLYAAATSQMTFRSPAAIARYFEGYALAEPGLVYLPRWRPEEADDLFVEDPERSLMVGGVGRRA